MRRILQCFTSLAIVGLSLSAAACSNHYVQEVRHPETGATLEGTVTYNGQKVTVALIIAQNDSGSAQAFIGDDGRYKLENVPIGQVHLAVNVAAGRGQMMSQAMAQSQGKAKGQPKVPVDVPAKYGDPTKSGVTTTVNAGANTFDIVLK